ncbi:MAG TPA: sensor histidine kinase, partial [Sporichthya sp.]|nr:sensor histidine kinase [Sporichthya sp.]
AGCQVLPYGVIGAVLVARRPDLPFGWLLSAAAAALVLQFALAYPALWAIESGHPSEGALWALSLGGSLGFVPVALQGVVNVRFPSGRPTGRWGRVLERVIVWGIGLGLLGGLLGDWSVEIAYPDGDPGGVGRVVDGTPLSTVGNALAAAVPLVILLGVLAGVGVVVRCVRAEGLERKQLQWRAAGVVSSLALFPLAVTEKLPDALVDPEAFIFVVTLVVPVLRYDLWAIDTLIRRSAAYTLSSSGSVVENMLRATAEMLRLPYLAIRRGDRVLAACGSPTTPVETWPLVHEGERMGDLVAAPPRGLSAVDGRDRPVLATLAQLVAGSIRAEALTADLLDARHRLVAAREEERRRLRRDLHDGLGPVLTGLGLNLDAARSQLERDPDRVAAYLTNAKDASAQVIADLRGLVYGLRPPALDEFGLVGALRVQTDRLAGDAGLVVELVSADELPLPAAVEVAAFRTVVEAVTNVARHSQAAKVRVELVRGIDDLTVEIADDGGAADGPAASWIAGVGLTGMRERAEELGGTFRAGPTPEGGLVHVRFPLGRINP